MVLGIIFGETSTQQFSFMFGDADGNRRDQLKSAYVQVDLPEGNNIVVAHVIDVNTENPLLAKDTAKFYSEPIEIPFPDLNSHRFTLYQARCEVIGRYDRDKKEINLLTEPIRPGGEVKLLSKDVLNEIFSDSVPWHLRLGYVKTPDNQTRAQVSLDADSILTMHACVFGMTGMGKTTSTAVLLEELMFRGAKTIVFDPHADYINLKQMNRDLYKKYFQKRVEEDKKSKAIIEEYRKLLNGFWGSAVTPWNEFDESFSGSASQEFAEELTDENIFYRLLNYCVIKDSSLMIDFTPTSEVSKAQLDEIIKAIGKLNLKDDVPDELLYRRLTIKLNVFPRIRVYQGRGVYMTMRLIEAMAGEGFSDAQQGYMIPWLLDSRKLNESDTKLLEYLRGRANKLGYTNQSRAALLRILDRAILITKALVSRGCKSLDVMCFVNDFCKMTGKLSKVSTVVFDLSDLGNDHAKRALVYAVMDFVFDEYKSKRLVMGKNAHPVLFALEEARKLIPRQDESGAGEGQPATRVARLASGQIATEGRKMGIGMLVISQKPAAVDPVTASQANTLILHRVINPDDQAYIRSVGESLSTDNLETLKTVGPGVAIVTGIAMKTRMSTLVKVRYRYSEEGTEKPAPIKKLWEGRS
ncbi:MAG: ATP-binding protein [Candidatus Poribacteria bacterium]|nr:ATP-binding protein [Candidatus Poribacteria bacterium]